MDPISAIASLVNTVVGRIWPDKSEADKERFALAMQVAMAEQQVQLAQIGVNTAQASSSNFFVSGPRPGIMWVCAASFTWQFVIEPVMQFLIVLSGHAPVAVPALDTTQLNAVLFGLLGLGAMRTYEKVSGVAK